MALYRSPLLLLAPLVVLAFVACGDETSTATASPTASAVATQTPSATVTSGAATIDVATDPALDEILINTAGFTLYRFTPEADGTIQCTAECATAWPPLLLEAASAEPVAGEGASGTLGTIARPEGGTQVTYNGAPLYLFAGDTQPGETKGQGVGGSWFVVLASGEAATPTATGTATPSGPSYGY